MADIYVKLEAQAKRFIDWAPSRALYGTFLGFCLGVTALGIKHHNGLEVGVPLAVFFVFIGIGRWLYYVESK